MADLDVYTDLFAGHVVVALRGELDARDASWLARALSAAAASGSRIIVDLAGLTFMDCSGVRALVTARMQARQAGGDLLLAEPRGAVLRLLSLLQVAGLVPPPDTAEMAAAWSVGAPDAGD
jgi:anti-anti-sigma factor